MVLLPCLPRIRRLKLFVPPRHFLESVIGNYVSGVGYVAGKEPDPATRIDVLRLKLFIASTVVVVSTPIAGSSFDEISFLLLLLLLLFFDLLMLHVVFAIAEVFRNSRLALRVHALLGEDISGWALQRV